MQDFGIFGFKGGFFLNILLKVFRNNIGSFISLAVIIINLEVILRQFLSDIYFSRTQESYIYEIVCIVMVY